MPQDNRSAGGVGEEMAEAKNPRPAGAAKHGKRHEMRLYSSSRRGASEIKRDISGGINPDSNINVASVCGAQVRVFGDVNSSGFRPLQSVESFPTHGAAVLYAQEFEEAERKARAKRSR